MKLLEHTGSFKRSPGYVPPEMEEYVFSEEFVSAHRKEATRCLRILGIPGQSRILDIGCGTATATIGLLDNGNDVVGLDLSRGMLKLAKKRVRRKNNRMNFIIGDMLNLPFRDNSFDAVTCMDVTFGFFGPEGDLLQLEVISRILKAGGRLMVETFDKEYGKLNPGSQEAGQYWGTYDPVTDRFSGLNLYSPEQWRHMLDQAAMELLRILSADAYNLQYTDYRRGHKLLIVLASKRTR